MAPTYGNWIAGDESLRGEHFFASVNPRTAQAGDPLYPEATSEEIDRACEAAAHAFTTLREFAAAKLAGFLDAVAAEIEVMSGDLIAIADRETALGVPRLTGELARTTGQLRAFGGLLHEGSYVNAIIDHALPDRQPAPRPDIRRMNHALGAVAVFSASNFPFAFAVTGGDSASAWAAGCPVVVKAHPGHPATSQLFAQAVNTAITKTGFPRGTFSLIQGTSTHVGQQLVTHPAISAVGFTGSLRGGRALFDSAARRERPIPVYAEMGSINPVIVLQSALETRLNALAEGLANSVTLGAGQFCTNPGVVIVQDSDLSRQWIATVTELIRAKAPAPLLNGQILTGLEYAVSATLNSGRVDVLTGGMTIEGEAFCYANTVLQTTGAHWIATPSLHREHFGAVTLFVVCRDEDELIAAVNALEGQLTATIHAETHEARLLESLLPLLREKAGRVLWNGFPTGVEVVYAQVHGGTYPATTAPATTSVGMTAIQRFMRPVAYQNMPNALLPTALQRENPLGIMRIVNGVHTRDAG
jgi:2,5-dioxopentanoate dehydrogenase